MEEIKGYCVNCKQMCVMDNPVKTKIRNRKSKTGSVEAWTGHCSKCQKTIYHIVGH